MTARTVATSRELGRHAFGVEASLVRILVAGDATLELAVVVAHKAEATTVFVRRFGTWVAGHATFLGMRSVDFERRPLPMVEILVSDFAEGVRVVTACAASVFDRGELSQELSREPIEGTAVGVDVATLTLAREAMEDTRFIVEQLLVAGVAVRLEVAATQGQSGELVLGRPEGVRFEMSAIVAGDASLAGEGTRLELTAVRIFVAVRAGVPLASRIPLGPIRIRRVAIRTLERFVRRFQRKVCQRMQSGIDHAASLVELHVRSQVAGDASGARLHIDLRGDRRRELGSVR